MPSLPISKVRENLFGLVKQVNDDHDTLTVVTKTGENAVLIAEADWNSLMETLYVLQTHGGIQLLKSAADARAGRTSVHALIDPDDDDATPAELMRVEQVTEQIAEAILGLGEPTLTRLIRDREVLYQLVALLLDDDATTEFAQELLQRHTTTGSAKPGA
ncbi:type II toxin-antitoxin system Phd/YefM family antitoxin [Nocardia sp. NPDC005978]|uniref:type II toxin-antitoxin system Phd/YefM family antitoxin n=1 Tax=Nocardia sp. NPDC005978 TaxID=3156725 RepID=UPI0033B8E86B